ncbi:MAG: hypothetical protein M3209_09620 [Acidobacteriota bacterium]|nr:hypothetical protein [Acidobacteriota bacterium]
MNQSQDSIVKILPMWQPWASFVVWGEKQNETRSWKPAQNWTGILAILATKTFQDEAKYLCATNEFFRRTLEARNFRYDTLKYDLPFGAIIGSVELFKVVSTDSVRDSLSPKEKVFGDYSAGRFAWQLRNHIELKKPISLKGQQGMWTAPDEIRDAILKSRGIR